jgi:hypothetical protein
MTLNKIPNENHQGFQEPAEWPEGIIPRIQKQARHKKFVRSNPHLDKVMLGIDDAARLLGKGDVFSSYFSPNVDLITTSTIHDQPLGELRWTYEETVVRAVGSQYHIPTDYWVYGDMEPEARKANIQAMMQGTKWFSRQLADTSTQIIPLVSGVNREEREICYQTFDELDASYCAVYGAQYFGGSMGDGINKLNNYIRDIVSEYPLEGVMLIGLQSADYLQRLPPEVVAAAGQRWIYQSGLRKLSIEETRNQFGQWKQLPESQLGRGIATLGSFTASNEVTA